MSFNIICIQDSGCSKDATCAIESGEVTCECKSGFTGDGKTCKPKNPCSQKKNACNAEKGNGKCVPDGSELHHPPFRFLEACKPQYNTVALPVSLAMCVSGYMRGRNPQ